MSLPLHQIALGPNAVGEALALVERFADPARAGTCARLAVIVEELVINLVEHAETGAASVIGLALAMADDGVRVVLEDEAPPFDPRTAPHVGDLPNEERGGGAGLAIVRAWSRVIAYSRVGGRNRLELLVYDRPDDP